MRTVDEAPGPDAVDRRSQLPVETFRREYLERGRPVVLTDVMDGCVARRRWTFDFFRREFGATLVDVATSPSGQERLRLPLADYIGFITRPDWDQKRYFYLSNWNFQLEHPELLRDFDSPPHFTDAFRVLPRRMRPDDLMWIFMGPAGSFSPLHRDVWATHAWLTQLVGRKHWVLYPPRQSTPLETIIGPGDTIFVPSGWTHKVTSLDASISLTRNFAARGCLVPAFAGWLGWYGRRVLRRAG